jgi:predicted transcriptional regulator
MQATKEKMIKIIGAQPDDASYEEIMKELVFELMVEHGLDDVRKGRTISNDEMKKKIASWQR